VLKQSGAKYTIRPKAIETVEHGDVKIKNSSASEKISTIDVDPPGSVKLH
jgi:hypothetical protein